MQGAGTNALVERMIGAARLDVHTYEAVERDRSATTSALIVVVLAALAGGIGGLADGIDGLIVGIIDSVLGWAVFAGLVYVVGTRLLATSHTSSSWGEILRTTGFAYTPNLLLLFGFIPILGGLIAIVALVWFLATSVVAIRQALEMSTGRAIATAIVALLARVLIAFIFAAILGVGSVFT